MTWLALSANNTPNDTNTMTTTTIKTPPTRKDSIALPVAHLTTQSHYWRPSLLLITWLLLLLVRRQQVRRCGGWCLGWTGGGSDHPVVVTTLRKRPTNLYSIEFPSFPSALRCLPKLVATPAPGGGGGGGEMTAIVLSVVSLCVSVWWIPHIK